MDASSSHQHRPKFSEILRTRLIEDACLRAEAALLQPRLEEARAAADQVRRNSSLAGRLAAVVGRKGPKHTPEEAEEVLAKEKALGRQFEEITHIVGRYQEDLDMFITMHLQETMPAFLERSLARKRLAEWEGLLAELRGELRNLLKALGQARNSAVAGYNKTTKAVSTTALEQFTKANELAHKVDARVRLANEKAAALGGLPDVAIIPLPAAVAGLARLDVGAMQKEFDRLIGELESLEQERIAELQAPAVEVAAGQEAQARAFAAQYREELREFSDRQMKPEDMARCLPGIMERFHQR